MRSLHCYIDPPNLYAACPTSITVVIAKHPLPQVLEYGMVTFNDRLEEVINSIAEDAYYVAHYFIDPAEVNSKGWLAIAKRKLELITAQAMVEGLVKCTSHYCNLSPMIYSLYYPFQYQSRGAAMTLAKAIGYYKRKDLVGQLAIAAPRYGWDNNLGKLTPEHVKIILSDGVSADSYFWHVLRDVPRIWLHRILNLDPEYLTIEDPIRTTPKWWKALYTDEPINTLSTRELRVYESCVLGKYPADFLKTINYIKTHKRL